MCYSLEKMIHETHFVNIVNGVFALPYTYKCTSYTVIRLIYGWRNPTGFGVSVLCSVMLFHEEMAAREKIKRHKVIKTWIPILNIFYSLLSLISLKQIRFFSSCLLAKVHCWHPLPSLLFTSATSVDAEVPGFFFYNSKDIPTKYYIDGWRNSLREESAHSGCGAGIYFYIGLAQCE